MVALHGLRPGVLREANNIRLLKRHGRGVIGKAPFGHMSIIFVYCLTWEGRRPEPRGGLWMTGSRRADGFAPRRQERLAAGFQGAIAMDIEV
jgi:hypothetical protein